MIMQDDPSNNPTPEMKTRQASFNSGMKRGLLIGIWIGMLIIFAYDSLKGS